jgi:hypothetical protein
MGTGRRDLAAFVIITATGVVTVAAVGGLIGVSPRGGWWWDQVWLAQAQVVFNIIGAGLAAGAVLYAWRVATKQFAMMQEQDAVIKQQLDMLREQKEVSKRIEALEAKQEGLLQKQTELVAAQGKMIEQQANIAVIQHQTWQEIQARHVMLEVAAIVRAEDNEQVSVELAVLNTGTKVAREVNWGIFIPIQSAGGVSFSQLAGRKEPNPVELSGGEMALAYKGEIEKPVFRKRQRGIATFSVENAHAHDFRIFWHANNDDGEFPPLEGADPAAIVTGEMRVTLGRGGRKTTFTQVPPTL